MRLLAAPAALAVALALAGPAQARPAASSVDRTVDVGPDGTALTLRCPTAALAMAGAVVATSPEVTTRASTPAGGNAWSFRFAGGPGRARAVLRCVRVRPSGGYRTTQVRVAGRAFNAAVPANGSRRAMLRCPAGYTATGYGLEQASSGTAIVTRARPGPRAWGFVLENEGSDDTRATLHIRCLVRVAVARGPAGRARHPLVVRVASWRDRVPGAGRRRVTHSCPTGHFSVAAGHSLQARDDVVATREFTFRRRPGRWLFVNARGGAAAAHSFLTCLSLRTGFR